MSDNEDSTNEGPEAHELDILLSMMGYHNDNKMTHAVLLCSILFGQLQFKGMFKDQINLVTIIHIPSNLFNLSIPNILFYLFFLIIYTGFILAGLYELNRFRVYSDRAMDFNSQIWITYRLNEYVNLRTLDNIVPQYNKWIKGKILANRLLLRMIYVFASLLIFLI